MTFLAELTEKTVIKTYAINHSSKYEQKSHQTFPYQIDDFYIDRQNRLYFIHDKRIYAHRYEKISVSGFAYKHDVIDTEYGCLFFWIEKMQENDDESNALTIKENMKVMHDERSKLEKRGNLPYSHNCSTNNFSDLNESTDHSNQSNLPNLVNYHDNAKNTSLGFCAANNNDITQISNKSDLKINDSLINSKNNVFLSADSTFDMEIVNDGNQTESYKYQLVCREADDKIHPKRILLRIESPDYKMLVINRKNFVLYSSKIVHIKYKLQFYLLDVPFKIHTTCYLSERLVFLDTEFNIHIYSLRDRKLIGKYKSLGDVSLICTSPRVPLISILTSIGLFTIDAEKLQILKSKKKEEIDFDIIRMEYINRRTILLFTKNSVYEYALMNNSIFAVHKNSLPEKCLFKYIHNTEGYKIKTIFEDPAKCKCNCYQQILNLKIELKRVTFELNEKIRELQDKIDDKN
ncbi:hypothetical protein EDEG_02769 [Edhazardia aedis USNM 41457]|uniref:CNH domain-containing protein n=1 Tax=Edhazardia aedis (strain USNM 41457) TaxID=1003232 RepID=J8ZT31_EDHAE|nr:hypothetical protein EDEG_02769 [Edhazardia aedis USNM 41457]|eukprot:EJW02828.1 hypothetical protein EDEG_02769 [Edhazardia aedis USNM 41457]